MELQYFNLTIFMTLNENIIETKNYGPFDNIKKANIFGIKKIKEIKQNFKTEFEFDFKINDITEEELY
jgi:hypothetical protein